MEESEVIGRILGDGEVFVAQSEDRRTVVYRSYAPDGSVTGSAVYDIPKRRLRFFDRRGKQYAGIDSGPPADWYESSRDLSDFY